MAGVRFWKMTTMLFAQDGSGKLQKKPDQKKLGLLLKRFAPLNFVLETGRKVPRGGDPPIEVSGVYKWKESTFTERERTKRQHLKRDHFQGTLRGKGQEGKRLSQYNHLSAQAAEATVKGDSATFQVCKVVFWNLPRKLQSKACMTRQWAWGPDTLQGNPQWVTFEKCKMKPKLQWASPGVWNFC